MDGKTDETEPPTDPVSAAVVKAAAGPLTEGGQKLLGRLLGGVADEFGGYLRDQVTIWRAGRGIYTAERAADMLKSAGLEPAPVRLKHLLAIMDGASLEDDTNLSEMWAALLANAAAGRSRGFEPAFADILRQLGAADVAILRAAAELDSKRAAEGPHRTDGLETTALFLRIDRYSDESVLWDVRDFYAGSDVDELRQLATFAVDDVAVAADNLFRLGLLSDHSTELIEVPAERSRPNIPTIGGSVLDNAAVASEQFLDAIRSPGLGFRSSPEVEVRSPIRERVELSSLGVAFMRACEPPASDGLFSEPEQESGS